MSASFATVFPVYVWFFSEKEAGEVWSFFLCATVLLLKSTLRAQSPILNCPFIELHTSIILYTVNWKRSQTLENNLSSIDASHL